MKAEELVKLLHKEIPITQALGIEVLELSEDNVAIRAPFAKNKNIHNTAFAGSIYTTATLAGWSLLTNFLDENNLSGSVVLASADIQYRKPITNDIVANCILHNDQQQKIKNNLKKSKTVKLPVSLVITDSNKELVKFTGTFAIF